MEGNREQCVFIHKMCFIWRFVGTIKGTKSRFKCSAELKFLDLHGCCDNL